MLFALAALLFAVWVLGVLSATMLGGFIHVFLLFAVVSIIARLMQGGHTS